MQRRKFLQLTGLSTAGLFFTRASAEPGLPPQALHFPSKVAVLRDGQWLPLTGSKEHWTLEYLSVNLRDTGRSMDVRVASPGAAIEQVRLSWDLVFPTTALYLGDHWER